jgi:hypothetical protein
MPEDFWRNLKEVFFQLRRECPLLLSIGYFAGPASSSWVQQASRRKTASGRVDIQCWGTIRTPAAAIWG